MDNKQIYMDFNTDDFNTMRSMLNEIEMKIMQLEPLHQMVFYKPLQNIILEAWIDACNKNDGFLYKQPFKKTTC